MKISALGLTGCMNLGRMHLILLGLFFICAIGVMMPTPHSCHSFIYLYKQIFIDCYIIIKIFYLEVTNLIDWLSQKIFLSKVFGGSQNCQED